MPMRRACERCVVWTWDVKVVRTGDAAGAVDASMIGEVGVCRCFRSGRNFSNWAWSGRHPLNSNTTCSPGTYGSSKMMTPACAPPTAAHQNESAPTNPLQVFVILFISHTSGCHD